MAALSDYLEGELLNHIFRNASFTKPTEVAIALTSGVPADDQTGANIPELPTGVLQGLINVNTNYARISLGDPTSNGDTSWNTVGTDESTAFQVNSSEVSNSGYFYPLYLTEAKAQEVDATDQAESYTFNAFPGVTFYAPLTDHSANDYGDDPGFTEYVGNGFIKNASEILFNTALTDWGWVSGVAVLDSSTYGEGNLLMYAQLENPRIIYTGDSIKFDANSLEISLS